jgi:hypothetical protein
MKLTTGSLVQILFPLGQANLQHQEKEEKNICLRDNKLYWIQIVLGLLDGLQFFLYIDQQSKMAATTGQILIVDFYGACFKWLSQYFNIYQCNRNNIHKGIIT